MITIQVQKIEVTKDVDRKKIYTPVDITSQVVMPIIDVERLDSTLDTSSITILNTEAEALKPFTRIIIRLDDGTTTQNIYRLVYTDKVEALTYGLTKKYQHEVELIEPTKWLERFEVDNTTITNFLSFLYEDPFAQLNAIQPFNKNTISDGKIPGLPLQVFTIESEGYRKGTYDDQGSTREFKPFYASYEIGQTINFKDTLMDLLVNYPQLGALSPYGTIKAKLDTYTIRKGRLVDNITTIYADGDWVNPTMTFNELTEYTIRQVYSCKFNGAEFSREYEWKIKVIEAINSQTKPQKKTLAQTLQIVLQRVGDETSILRQDDVPMFNITNETYEKLNAIESPEFTFSQNTLFGILEQIAEQFHAIPRLLPRAVTKGDGTIDDWSEWNVIGFDELGKDEEAKTGELTGYERNFNGDNYATNYTTNVENSFQTNKEDYIAITEPYDGGFISTRTESSDFEVSANSACIKLSRPVQRIVQIICRINNSGSAQDVDITPYVLESADYNLLTDYVKVPATQEAPHINSKEMAIYFTRGDNVIRGLDYVRPARFTIDNLFLHQAIFNILRRATGGSFGSSWTAGWNMDDLMFQVKYIPYYGMKLKQYKNTIKPDSGNNELFFNQQNSQMVDIEAYGENIKGALLRTANEEITRTEYFTALADVVKAGQKRGEYYAYQINKEITNYRIKTSTEYSKNWNKWNEYVAIKKNYRQWEISEKESVNTNPVKNEFCIATDKDGVEERGINKILVSWTPADPEVTLPSPYRFWGWMFAEEMPTDAQITAFAESQITNPFDYLETSDEVIVKIGETNYKCYYDEDLEEWNKYEATPNYVTGRFVGAVRVESSALRTPGVTATGLPNGIYLPNKVLADSTVDGYFYDATDGVIGNALYKDASNTPFASGTEIQNATTFYHDGAVYTQLKDGDYAIAGTINNPSVYLYTYNYEVSPLGSYWKYMGTYGTQQSNTKLYDPLLTAYARAITGGHAKIGDIIYMVYTAQTEPVLQILQYVLTYDATFTKWQPIVTTRLGEINENGYGLNAIEYLESQFKEDGFSTPHALREINRKLHDDDTSDMAYQDEELKAIDWAVMTTQSREYNNMTEQYQDVSHTFLTPCACFSFGNSIVVNFQTKDNYSAGTFIDPTLTNSGTYSIENYVKYADKYGNFNNFTLAFGSGNAKKNGFNTLNNSKTSSKEFYKIEESEINEGAVTLDYRTNPFQFVKDSRQQISYTGQLHFVSELEEVTFGSAFAQAMPFVGNTLNDGAVRYVGFLKKPNKFLSEKANDDDIVELGYIYGETPGTRDVNLNIFTKTIRIDFWNDTDYSEDPEEEVEGYPFIGVGIIDNENNIMLYYDREIEAGESATLFLEFRHDI